MAKLKLNLDWKALLLAHGEKGVVALVSVLVVILVWRAIGREGMPVGQEPEDIAQRTEQASSYIQELTWDTFPDQPNMQTFRDRSIMDEIEVDGFTTAGVLDPTIFPPSSLRTDPVFLPIVELEVSTGFGPFAVADQAGGAVGRGEGELMPVRPARPGVPVRPGARPNPRGGGGLLGEGEFPVPGGGGLMREEMRPLPPWFDMGGSQMRGGRVEGRRWVVVNGLVPLTKQQEAYDLAFREAEGYDPNRDMPDYLGCIVERADVTHLEAGAAPAWETVMTMKTSTMSEVAAKFGTQNRQDVVEPQYTHELLTYPLGPLMMTAWGDDARHSRIPRAPTPDELEAMRMQEAQPEQPAEEVKKPDDFGFLEGRENRLGGEAVRRGGGRRAIDRVNMAEGEMPMMGRGMGRMGGEMGQGAEQVENLLFRFFDFDVRPGHRYRYRATLVIVDPNFSNPRDPAALPVKYLDKKVADRVASSKGYLLIPSKQDAESQPAVSPPISVPFDGDVFAGEIKAPAPGAFYVEPEATVLVKEFDERTGRTIAAKRQMQRGSVTRFTQTIWVPDPAQQQLVHVNDQKFTSEFILLDMHGGDKIPEPGGASRGGRPPSLNTLAIPAEMVFLDSAGNLIVRRELEDYGEITLHDELVAEPDIPGNDLVPGRGEERMLEGEGNILFDEGAPTSRPSRGRSRSSGGER